MKTILDAIIKNKLKEVKLLKKKKPLLVLKKEVATLPKKQPRFLKALSYSKNVAVIAEIKKKSPSKGILRKNFNPVVIAKAYKKGGASALSVLTDKKYFAGSLEILKSVRASTTLPILRKDFIVDEYQVYESRLAGADAILLIASVLSVRELKRLYRAAKSLGLDVLFEIHEAGEVDKVKAAGAKLVGINNRDLKTFKVDMNTTSRLSKKFNKNTLLVSESGIQKYEDLIYLKGLGVQAVLVGESLMREHDTQKALERLLGKRHG